MVSVASRFYVAVYKSPDYYIVFVLIYRNATRDQSCMHVMLVGFIRTVSNVLATK